MPSTTAAETGTAARDVSLRGTQVSARQELVARIFTWVAALGAFTSVALWVIQFWGRRHASWLELTFTFLNIPVSNSLISVVILFLMLRALVGRKRLGLVAVAFFQIIGVLVGVEVLTGIAGRGDTPRIWGDWRLLGPLLDMGAVVPALIILGLCWWVRPAFPGRLRPGSWTTLIATVVIGLGITALVTWALLTYSERDATDPQVVRAVVLHALGFTGVWTGPQAVVPPLVSQIAAILVSATILLAVVLFTRSSRDAASWTPDSELEVRGLLHAHGDQDSLGYFATRRDKSLVFSSDRRAAVAYDVLSGVALAAGDPVGDRHSWDDAISRWKSQARWYGWVPAVIGAGEAGARAYVAAGFDVIALGDEAILRPDTYRLNNTSMTSVRRAVQHARRAGLTTSIRRQQDIDDVELAELVAMADAWREGGSERGFSMALDRRGDPADRRVVWVTAHDVDGKCFGLLSFVPWGATGLSLDMGRPLHSVRSLCESSVSI